MGSAADVEATREDAFGGDAALGALLHGLPESESAVADFFYGRCCRLVLQTFYLPPFAVRLRRMGRPGFFWGVGRCWRLVLRTFYLPPFAVRLRRMGHPGFFWGWWF